MNKEELVAWTRDLEDVLVNSKIERTFGQTKNLLDGLKSVYESSLKALDVKEKEPEEEEA